MAAGPGCYAGLANPLLAVGNGATSYLGLKTVANLLDVQQPAHGGRADQSSPNTGGTVFSRHVLGVISRVTFVDGITP